MPNRAIYLLVVEGFADWEPAHAVAELRRHGGYRVETVGLDRNPVISMGGLRITPSRTIDELDINDVAVFILPGGDRWENMPVEPELESALKQKTATSFMSNSSIVRDGVIRRPPMEMTGLRSRPT